MEQGLGSKEDGFQVYLVDYGGLLTVAPDQMRLCSPATANYQVSLACLGPSMGVEWGEQEGKLQGEIINSSIE